MTTLFMGLSIVNAPQTAIGSTSGTPIIKHCSFTDNGTPGIWGAIKILGNATVENCEIKRNKGLFVIQSGENGTTAISFKNCTFFRQYSNRFSHLLRNTVLDNCLFVRNDGNVLG